jgi:hypothetical protein
VFAPGNRACGYRTVPGRSKWLSRDPIEERGGLNLYGFVKNAPIASFDINGLLIGNVSIFPNQAVEEDNGPIYQAHFRGWHIGLHWTPPRTPEWSVACACKPCQKALWTQLLKKNNNDWKDDITMANHTISDVVWSCYPGHDSAGPNSMDYSQTEALMSDQPGIYGSDLTLFLYDSLRMQFISTLVCIEGKDRGKVYAMVTWGFSWKYNLTPVGDQPTIY